MSEQVTREQKVDAWSGVVSHHGKLVYESASGRREEPVDEAVFAIGSARDNDLILDDEYVSRNHVRIERAPDQGYRVCDLESRNGTFVNGQWTREAALPFGSTLRIGRTEMRFLPAEETLAVDPSEEEEFGELVGSTVGMRTIFALLGRIAPSDASILFGGETGTGKELAALAVHDASERQAGPFVVVDCSALHDTLMESELFGHEKGAFTGAEDRRVGAFERADGGTVFLDEIGELPLERQTLLLRVLEARQFRRVGGNDYRPTNIRLVSSTHRDLRAEVRTGRFREDLYYRLAVFEVRLPPLAQRLDDLPTLCAALLERSGSKAELAPASMQVLRGHHWPGNVRELRNVLDRARVLAGDGRIDPQHLLLGGTPDAATDSTQTDSGPFANVPLNELERRAIVKTLKANSGNLGLTAQVLGIARSTLYEKLRRYGIRR